jgi:hypothetical protein
MATRSPVWALGAQMLMLLLPPAFSKIWLGGTSPMGFNTFDSYQMSALNDSRHAATTTHHSP